MALTIRNHSMRQNSNNFLLSKLKDKFDLISLLVLIGLINYFNYPMITLKYNNLNEIYYQWWDEGVHIKNILKIINENTLELEHLASTAFYHIQSAGLGLLIGSLKPDLQDVVLSSLIISSFWIQASIFIYYIFLNTIFKSKVTVVFGILALGTHSSILFHSAVIHPEGPMIFGIIVSLFGSYRFLTNPTKNNLIFTTVGLGISLAGKVQSILNLPSIILIYLISVNRRKMHINSIFIQISIVFITLVLTLLITTPYQIIRFDQLLIGISHEKNVQSFSSKPALLDLLSFIVSNNFIGYYYLILTMISLIIILMNKKNHKTEKNLFLLITISISIPLLYNIFFLNVLINRYYVHMLPVLILMITYFFDILMKLNRSRILKYFSLLLVLIGIQQHIKTADFYFSKREGIMNEIKIINSIESFLSQQIFKDEMTLGLGFNFFRNPTFNFDQYPSNQPIKKYQFIIISKNFLKPQFYEGSSSLLPGEEQDQKIRENIISKIKNSNYIEINSNSYGNYQLFKKI